MVDSIAAPQHFTTVNYVTKDGEHVSATKNNGVVTLVGDKKGTRQMPIDEFKQELIQNSAKIQLEKTPEKDTVEISKAPKAEETPKMGLVADDVKVTEADPAEKAVKTDKKPEAPAISAEPEKAEAKEAETGKKLDVAA